MDKKVEDETMKISFQEPGLHAMHGVEQVWWRHWVQHYQTHQQEQLSLVEIGHFLY